MSLSTIQTIFQKLLSVIESHEAELGKLDAVAGDGDHGIGMVRGLTAASRSLESEEVNDKSDGEAIAHAGAAFSDAAGGSSGALVGIFIITIGNHLSAEPDTSGVHKAMQLGFERMKALGKSEPGQKTMLDTLHPFLAALEEAREQALPQAWHSALPAATRGMESTKEMQAGKGRAARLGDRSQGHADPGAVSMHYMLQTVGEVIAEGG